MPFALPTSTLDQRKSPQKVRKAAGGGEWHRSRRSPGSARTARAAHAWKVRYRDPDRVERSRTFRTEADARRFASKIEVSVNEGTYIDPSLGRTLFQDWAEDWLEATEPALKPHTVSGYRTLLRKHVIPALGSMQLAKVRAIDVRRFVAELSSERSRRSTYSIIPLVTHPAAAGGPPELRGKHRRALTRESQPRLHRR